MNSKSLPIIIGVVLILVVGGLVYTQSGSEPYTPSAPVTMGEVGGEVASTTTTTTGVSTEPTYTAAQVATHKDATSCWTIIDGNVYDLTQWIGKHPGGEQAIRSLCGVDGTVAFHGQHDDAKKQADILVTFKIGTLAQ